MVKSNRGGGFENNCGLLDRPDRGGGSNLTPTVGDDMSILKTKFGSLSFKEMKFKNFKGVRFLQLRHESYSKQIHKKNPD